MKRIKPNPPIAPTEPGISILGAITGRAHEGTFDRLGMGLHSEDPLLGYRFRLLELCVPTLGAAKPALGLWTSGKLFQVLLFGSAMKAKMETRKYKYWLIRGYPWIVRRPVEFIRNTLDDGERWEKLRHQHTPFLVIGCPYAEWIRPAPPPPSKTMADEIIERELNNIKQAIQE